jgi:hypothetical protein
MGSVTAVLYLEASINIYEHFSYLLTLVGKIRRNVSTEWLWVRENRSSQNHALLKGVNKILPYFLHIYSDLDTIRYRMTQQNLFGGCEFRENRRRQGRTSIMA